MMFLDKTLEELGGQDWGEPTFQSGLVINCHRLRQVPLKDWAADDLGRFILPATRLCSTQGRTLCAARWTLPT